MQLLPSIELLSILRAILTKIYKYSAKTNEDSDLNNYLVLPNLFGIFKNNSEKFIQNIFIKK